MIVIIGAILILAFHMWRGHSKGLVHIVLQLCSTVAAIILAALLVAPVTDFIQEKTPLYDAIEKQSGRLIEKEEETQNQDALKVEITEDESTFRNAAKQVMDKLGVPENIQDSLLHIDVVQLAQEGITTVSDLIIRAVTEWVCAAIIFILLFLIMKIIFSVVIKATDLINKVPLIGNVNQLAGLLVGAVYGIVVVWIALVIIHMFGNTQWAQWILTSVNGNPVAEFIYNSNMILNLITK